jgi:hypothetical protein
MPFPPPEKGENNQDKFPIQNGLEEDALLSLLFNFASEYVIRNLQRKQAGLKLKATHQLLV